MVFRGFSEDKNVKTIENIEWLDLHKVVSFNQLGFQAWVSLFWDIFNSINGFHILLTNTYQMARHLHTKKVRIENRNWKETDMKVIKGHLTQTEKKHIAVLINRGLTEGKINRKIYHLSKTDDIYTVKISEMDRGLVSCGGSKLRLSTYTHQFRIN